jgi:magnesium-transporting ATPase (P-type)
METEIQKLRKSDIRCKVITGDTVFTAVSVAMESGMIKKNSRVLMAEAARDRENNLMVTWKEVHAGSGSKYDTELAITGSAFSLLRDYCTDRFQKISYYRLITRTHVFAEMLAAQKAELIHDLRVIFHKF